MSERPAEIREIAARQVERLGEVVAGLSDTDLVAPTRCAGWLAAHLLVHIRQGLEEHGFSFAEPAGAADVVDRDYISYWRDFPPGNRPADYRVARYYWAAASTHGTADSLRGYLADTVRQATGMSRHAPAGVFRLQGHVMTAEDILAMWTAEWVIHQLDLTAFLPGDRPGPVDEAAELTVRTVDGLTGGTGRPPGWDDATYVLKAAGRMPLSEAERESLGARAGAFPALG